jgi:hypothetical protein
MAVYRTTDFGQFLVEMEKYKDAAGSGDYLEWALNPDNMIIMDDNNNIGLLEKHRDGLFTCHSFFNDRGKSAIKRCREMIRFGFNELGVEVLRGVTPVSNKASRWFNRQLGFTSYGTVDHPNEPVEIFILTKKEFTEKENKNG